MLNNFCFHVYAQKSLSHSYTLSFSLLSYVYAQKSLFIAENCNGFFLTPSPCPLTLEFIFIINKKTRNVVYVPVHPN